MKTLVTGAAGFIGSHLAAECAARGWKVIAIDSLTDYYSPVVKQRNLTAIEDKGVTIVRGDLVKAPIDDLLDDVDLVFHLAAQPGVRASWGQQFDTYVRENVTAVQHLLERCKGITLEKFVFASSSSVYGDAETLPTGEDAPTLPVSPYGATKVLGENLCRVYWRNWGVPVTCVRYFTVYGPRQRPDMAFHRMINAALTDQPVSIFGDGEQSRDFTNVSDAVAGTIAAGLNGRPGRVYNLGGGSRISINEMLTILTAILGRPFETKYSEAVIGDARHTAADTSRAAEELGYAPTRRLEEGLGAQVDWQREMLPLLSAT
jgi:nucleoside-diphosphate-sugar epimerase